MCLGNFDGVHLAHASLLRRGMALRDEKMPDKLCGVFTFTNPSSDYLRTQHSHGSRLSPDTDEQELLLRKSEHRRHLTTLSEKLRLFQQMGMDFVCLCDFSEIRALSPERFLTFLSKELRVRGAVCGFNYHFGVGGTGTTEALSTYFDRPDQGYFCSVEPPFCMDGDTVSSTRIRKFLLNGQVDMATRHLGHPYILESEVVKGKQLGRTLGFPTANQNFHPESVVPAHGVYAVICHTPAGIFPGVVNVGSHPTVDEYADVNCETYIIGPSQSLYGYRMRIEFLHRLRGEKRFDSVEALTQAIAHDAEEAEAFVRQYLKP